MSVTSPLIYGVINLTSGEGRLCQAGHPTPFIVTPHGQIRTVGEGGAPVGLMPHLSWTDVSFTLAPGERLCLFSDGITECENLAREQFGQERLQTCIQDSIAQAPDDLLQQLGQHLIRWRSGENTEQHAMADDVSLLIIEHQGENL